MKLSSVVLLASAELAISGPVKINNEKRSPQFIGNLIAGVTNLGYGKIEDPKVRIPKRVDSASDIPIPGAKRIKIRSGPYSVPGMGTKGLSGHYGMLYNYYDRDIEMPCTNCNILRQTGGLEFLNGTNANIDSGMWLHHMVQFNTGPRRWDPVAYNAGFCVPFFSLGTSAKNAERQFVTGNERTPFEFYQHNVAQKTAYHLDNEDTFTYLVEFMNMNMSPQQVYMTMTYDVLPGPLPENWNEIKVVYLDANSCGTSEVHPPQETGAFSIWSKPWTPNIEGPITFAMTHLHDGGVNLGIQIDSRNSSLCLAQAKYSESPEYVYRGMDHGKNRAAKDHISSMTGCDPQDFRIRDMKKDQSWTLSGGYDYDTREGNLEEGKQSEIMAISNVLVSVPRNLPKP